MAAERTSYTLKTPIQFGTQQITTLEFRAPKAADIRSFPLTNQNAGDLLNIAAKLCGQPAPVIDELGAEDIIGVAQLVAGFLPPGLLTGIAL